MRREEMIESYQIRSSQRCNMVNFFDNEEIWAFYSKSRNILVSTKGNIKSSLTNKALKQQITKQGYKLITFRSLEGKRVTKHTQRLVAETFIYCKNKDYLEVNHINGKKGDNSIDNLEWMTRQENLQHARDTGLFKKQMGKDNGRFKYSNELVSTIKADKGIYTCEGLATKYNLTKRQILHILYRR